MNNKEMREYLASRDIHVKSDSTTYLRRLTSRAKEDERQGLKSSLKELRGHEEQKFRYVKGKPGKRARFAVDNELSAIKQYLRRTTNSSVTFGTYGMAREDSPKRKSRDITKPIWLSVRVDADYAREALSATEDMLRAGDITEEEATTTFVNFISNIGQEWYDVRNITILAQ